MAKQTKAQRKLDLTLHPVRLRILVALTGAEQTAGQIAAALHDVPASSIYRHLQTLIAAGLVEVVAERPVRGAVERTLRAAPGAGRLGPDELSRMTVDDHRRGALIFVTQLLHEFDRYLRRGDADLLRDLVGLTSATFYATDEEWLAAIQRLNLALQPLAENKPGNGRKRRRIATITMPVEEQEPATFRKEEL